MGRSFLLCAMVLGVLGCVNARTLSQTGASCQAASFLEILVTEGTCSGQAAVTCDAQASSVSEFNAAFADWFAGDPKSLCRKERIDAAALAVGRAVASLYAEALVQVSCSAGSSGSSCGWSIGKGSAWAVATAEALAFAAVDLGPDRAICQADVTALSGVFVDVAGSVQAAACQSGPGSQSQNQDLYLESVRFAIADAFAWASAEFCDLGSEVIARSKCRGTGTSTTGGGDTQTGSGSGTGGGGSFPACTGAGAAKCCASGFRFSRCNCSDCEGPWKEEQSTSQGLRVWSDRKNNFCFCV
ncbi:hypothetical protein BSKO_05471 [Bryopsis sp. KO-2023]|nr:hypothetical protein BSKO_05471 [Bryopsis sp. KO-2023]